MLRRLYAAHSFVSTQGGVDSISGRPGMLIRLGEIIALSFSFFRSPFSFPKNTNGTRCLFIYLNSFGKNVVVAIWNVMIPFHLFFLFEWRLMLFFFVRSIPIGPRHYALLSDMIVLSRFGRQSLVVDIKESGFSFSFDSILVTLRATATAEE